MRKNKPRATVGLPTKTFRTKPLSSDFIRTRSRGPRNVSYFFWLSWGSASSRERNSMPVTGETTGSTTYLRFLPPTGLPAFASPTILPERSSQVGPSSRRLQNN